MAGVNPYKEAWNKLRNEVLDRKTGWGKEQLKKEMDSILIEYLEKGSNIDGES